MYVIEDFLQCVIVFCLIGCLHFYFSSAEAELLEKAMNAMESVNAHLPSDLWEEVLQELKPCLIKLSDGVEDRFYLRHHTLKIAIQNR